MDKFNGSAEPKSKAIDPVNNNLFPSILKAFLFIELEKNPIGVVLVLNFLYNLEFIVVSLETYNESV